MYFVTMRRSFGHGKKNTKNSGTPPLTSSKRLQTSCCRAMRRCLKDPLAKEVCPICFPPSLEESWPVIHFQTGPYRPYQFMTLQMSMRSWREWIWKNIIHVAERAFIKGAAFPFKMMISAPFAIPTHVAKQTRGCGRHKEAG